MERKFPTMRRVLLAAVAATSLLVVAGCGGDDNKSGSSASGSGAVKPPSGQQGGNFPPPVDREVTSKDVKYAMERFFTENVGGQYGTYFADIEGAPSKPGS